MFISCEKYDVSLLELEPHRSLIELIERWELLLVDIAIITPLKGLFAYNENFPHK